MKIDKISRSDIEKFYDFIKRSDSNWINSNQDFILTSLSLILNQNFHKSIFGLRTKYNIPSKWYEGNETPDHYENELLDWLEENRSNGEYGVPTATSEEITEICTACGVDPEKYSFYVFNYLYLADVRCNDDVVSFGPSYSGSEDSFRYKCGIKFFGKGESMIADNRRLYIRLYRDTSINKLKDFIEEKKDLIRFIQDKLEIESYSPTKGFSVRFQRDIEVYLLSLLDNKAPKIGKTLTEEHIDPIEDTDPDFQNIEKFYSLEDSAIRQIIKDINTRIHKATLGPLKV